MSCPREARREHEVLLVEDSEDLALLTKLLLENHGYMVQVAANGAEGLTLLHEHLPDVVVMDIEMPVLTGPEMVARMFVNNCGEENIPVVLVSGSVALRNLADSIGTPYYLAKPFPAERLLSLVDRALHEGQVPRPPLAS
jgi:CheY-like chemotaxis protein